MVEECPELDQWRPRRAVWKDWREALGGRAVSKKKEEEEEGDLLGAFFYRVYEFLFSFSNPPPVVHRPHLPERYAIRFVPATAAPASVSVPVISFVSAPAAFVPPRYAIAFVPALYTVPPALPVTVSPAVSAITVPPVLPVTSSVHAIPAISASSGSDFSVVSSANFVPASAFTSSSCIGTTQ